jgi:hypothetical protein
MTAFGASVVEEALDKISKKRSGKGYHPLDVTKENLLELRNKKYEALSQLINKAKTTMSFEQRQFFFENVELGLLLDWRPSQAAELLLNSLKEKDSARSWASVEAAIKPLEQLEVEILRAERSPFEHWYRETWIRPKPSLFNVHRSYSQMREFINLNGMETPIKPAIKTGHRIPQHQLWNKFLEDLEKVKKNNSDNHK